MAKSWSSMTAEEKIEAIKDHSNNNLERIAKLEAVRHVANVRGYFFEVWINAGSINNNVLAHLQGSFSYAALSGRGSLKAMRERRS